MAVAAVGLLRGHLRAHSFVAAAALDNDERLSLLSEALESYHDAEDFLMPSVVRLVAEAYARHGFLTEAVNAQGLLGANEEFVARLAAGAPSLNQGHLRWIAVAADVLPDPVRGQVIVTSVAELPKDSQPDEALSLARLLARHYGTGAVAAGLPAEMRGELTDVAAEEAREAADVIRIVRTFPYLPAEELAPARQRVLGLVADPRNFPAGQGGRLAEFIAEDVAAEIARSAETIDEPRDRARVLGSVLPRLHGGARACHPDRACGARGGEARLRAGL